MSQIVIGTSNPSKIREIASILSPLGHELIPCSMDVEEIGRDIVENAVIKAKAYSAANPGKYVIAEDSGLMCEMIQERGILLPGPYSARFHSLDFEIAGYLADGTVCLEITNVPKEDFTTDKTEHDRLNNERLIDLISKLPRKTSRAYFGVCFAIALDGEVVKKFYARSDGRVIAECRGENGFGYDPVFIGDDSFGKTYAELDSARKNLRSHRHRALKELGSWIEENIKDFEYEKKI